MLDFDDTRPPVPPRAAATLVLLRDRSPRDEVEACVMQRSLQSSFMGGAVVFPGGRVEPFDTPAAWSASPLPRAEGRWWDDEAIAARVAACREALEEIGVIPLGGEPLPPQSIAELRAQLGSNPGGLAQALAAMGRSLDLRALVPLARWVTPTAERRRFDARFFVARCPQGQSHAIDAREAVRAYWATPSSLLAAAKRGEISLFPPTHRTLQTLAPAHDVDEVFAIAAQANLAEICPRFVVEGGVPTLALPGDELHSVNERRVAGATRYVLRGDRWTDESE